MSKYIFEVQVTTNGEVETKTVVGFGNNKDKATEDVFFQLCEGSNIPKENIKVVRLISAD